MNHLQVWATGIRARKVPQLGDDLLVGALSRQRWLIGNVFVCQGVWGL